TFSRTMNELPYADHPPAFSEAHYGVFGASPGIPPSSRLRAFAIRQVRHCGNARGTHPSFLLEGPPSRKSGRLPLLRPPCSRWHSAVRVKVSGRGLFHPCSPVGALSGEYSGDGAPLGAL